MIGQLPLRHLVPMIMLITLGLLYGALQYVISPQISEQTKELSYRTMEETLESLKASLSPDLSDGDDGHIERDIFFSSASTTSRGILLVDTQGVILHAHNPNYIGRDIASLDLGYDRSLAMTVIDNGSVAIRDNAVGTALVSGYAGIKYTDASDVENNVVLFVVNDYKDFEARLKKLAEEPIYIGAGIISFSMLLMFLIIYSTITSRVGQLMDAAERLGAGEEGARVNLKGRDEFARLGKVFDQMADYVESSYESMEKALRQAEAASHAKTDFLANISHEIRTPLTGVIGMLDAADQSKLPPEARKYTHLAQASAHTLLDLINDILDISQLEAGKKRLNLAPCRVDTIATTVANALGQSADVKGLDFSMENRLPGEVWALGDEKVIRQIMFNLLGNAIKFTDKGSVTVELEGLHMDRGKNRIAYHFTVKDTGIGISKENIERLFNRFEQVEDFSKSSTGTGLGLAICRELVGLMNGKLWVESEEGEGSTFHVTFDLETVAKPDTLYLDMKKNTLPIFQESMSVLAVDDNPINRMVIEKAIQDLGLAITLKESGEAAYEDIKDKLKSGADPYDIILMDIHMPDMDGIETLAKIRVLGGWANFVPAIALTAHAITGQADEFMSQGMSGYVSKPIDRVALAREIARLTNGKLGTIPHPNEQTADAEPTKGKVAGLAKKPVIKKISQKETDDKKSSKAKTKKEESKKSPQIELPADSDNLDQKTKEKGLDALLKSL